MVWGKGGFLGIANLAHRLELPPPPLPSPPTHSRSPFIPLLHSTHSVHPHTQFMHSIHFRPKHECHIWVFGLGAANIQTKNRESSSLIRYDVHLLHPRIPFIQISDPPIRSIRGMHTLPWHAHGRRLRNSKFSSADAEIGGGNQKSVSVNQRLVYIQWLLQWKGFRRLDRAVKGGGGASTVWQHVVCRLGVVDWVLPTRTCRLGVF